MSKPPQKTEPPVVEGPPLPTILVSDCVFIGMQGDLLTFAFAETRPASGPTPPRMEKRIVARLAMTTATFDKMTEKAVRLAGAAQMNQTPSDPKMRN